MQTHKVQFLVLWEVDVVLQGWTVELGAESQRVGVGHGSITIPHLFTDSLNSCVLSSCGGRAQQRMRGVGKFLPLEGFKSYDFKVL